MNQNNNRKTGNEMFTKTPYTDINEFLTTEVNIEIYDNIEKFITIGLINPLEFFNSLHFHFDFFKEYSSNYIKINEQFKSYVAFDLFGDFENEEAIFFNKLLLFESLQKLINSNIPIENRTGITLKSIERIDNIVIHLQSFLKNSNSEILNLDKIEFEIKDFSIDNKMKYFLNLKNEKLKQLNEWSSKDFLGPIVKSFQENDAIHSIIKICNSEIKKLTRLKEIEPKQNELTKQSKAYTENLHPTMFINDSYKLFEYILENHIAKNRGRINDISFYYWKMYNDKLIIQKPFTFQKWFSENYNEDIGKIQTLNTVSNNNRITHYSTSLDWYKTVKL